MSPRSIRLSLVRYSLAQGTWMVLTCLMQRLRLATLLAVARHLHSFLTETYRLVYISQNAKYTINAK